MGWVPWQGQGQVLQKSRVLEGEELCQLSGGVPGGGPSHVTACRCDAAWKQSYVSRQVQQKLTGCDTGSPPGLDPGPGSPTCLLSLHLRLLEA